MIGAAADAFLRYTKVEEKAMWDDTRLCIPRAMMDFDPSYQVDERYVRQRHTK